MLQSHSSAQAVGLNRPAHKAKQQRRFRGHALHAPAVQHGRTPLSLLAAAPTLQDLQIKPFQPTEQQEPHSDSSSTHLVIPPVCEWAKDAALMAGCEQSAAPLRVAVLVSGGVDSSLALQLVAAAGHKSTAFYLQIWFQEDFRNFWDSCPWEEDLDYAKKLCDGLNIPLVVVPLTQQYWDRVVSHSVAEIKAGRTPNPDMLCNSRVKFGAFVEYLETEYAGQFDRIASGHYARMITQQQHQHHQQQHQQHQQQNHGGQQQQGHSDQQQQQQQHGQQLLQLDPQLTDHLASHNQASSSSSSTSSSSMSRLAHTQASSTNSISQPGHDPGSNGSSSSSQRAYDLARSSGSIDQPGQDPGSNGSSSSSQRVHDLASSSSSISQPGYGTGSDGSSSGGRSSSQPGGPRYLCLTPDAVKDQTYFLAQLSADQLARCMFPLGGFTKPQVRALATAAGLATSGRKDSQGICFLGKVKFTEFVKEHLGEWPGPLVEQESGEVVGVHDGYWFFTVGQRGGIKLPGGPWYVAARDMTQNVVYVSRSYHEADKRRDAFVCGPFNWLSELRPQPHRPLHVKVRHGPTMLQCHLHLGPQEAILHVAANSTSEPGSAVTSTSEADGTLPAGTGRSGQQQQQQRQGFSSSVSTSSAARLQDEGLYGMVALAENDQGLAAGQYAVFYQDGVCLGSAQMLGTASAAR